MTTTEFLYPSEQDIRALMKRIRGVKVAVFGDFCVDAYWAIDSSFKETSIETGKMIQHIREQRYSPGGAGNVVVNLRALGVEQVETFGVIGPDPFGQKLLKTFEELGVAASGMLVQSREWDTPVYGKPLLDGAETERMDFGAFNALHEETWQRLLNSLEAAGKRLDFLIVNQQLLSGWCNETRAMALSRSIQTNWQGRNLVDTRHFMHLFGGATQKINEYEAASLVGRKLELNDVLGDDESLILAQQAAEHGEGLLFLTRRNRGLMVCHRKEVHPIPGILILGPTDTVGAGDTVTAALAGCLASGIHGVQAACFANLAAAITVQKINQTGTATESELVQAVRQVAYVSHPSLADEVRFAKRVGKTDIEIVETPPQGRIQFALFDHDGTISTLRQGWEKVMEPVMMRAILGNSYEIVESSLFHRVRSRVRDYIEQSTGIQTLIQMDALASMVREFGIVPENGRLDAQGYKDCYIDALMAMINDRVARLQRGELDVSDFILKGAVDFLRALRKNGITLYLASGTDEEDVIREARTLGYAELFNGGIFGAKRGSRVCSKEQVIVTLIEKDERRQGGFWVVGDGPVEIQQARRYGGCAIGVASHEERRFGLSETKRRRLVRAGAHLIVPDFSQWQHLLRQIAQPIFH